MAKIPFNVDANTARLIGRENVSKLDGAILELIKNTYDADALKCFMYYEKSSNCLWLGDNGTGMSQKIIVDNWMTIGRSTKRKDYKTKKGRIQTGAKGIGRFALDRIGDDCEMLTATEQSTILWRVKWSDFDFGKSITDINADLDNVSLNFNEFCYGIKNQDVIDFIASEFSKTGTMFKICNLRDEWNIATIDRIRNGIKTLIPNEIGKVFNVNFFEEETKLAESQMIVDASEIKYDYKISFTVDECGSATIKLNRNEFDFGGNFDKIMKNAAFSAEDISIFKGAEKVVNLQIGSEVDGSLNIGPFHGVLYYYKKMFAAEDKEKYYYKDNLTSNFDDKFKGIKLYRDDFRVRPYGEFNTSLYDWLLLAYRKNKSPASIAHPTGAWRVNVDQIIGSIFISRENHNLADQSNREGIVDSKEFTFFKEFILDAIKEFEKDRQNVCRKLNEYYIATHPVEQTEKDIISAAAANKPNAGVGTRFDAHSVKKVLDRKDEAIQFLEDENRLLRTLATTGIITNTYIHEIKGLTNQLVLKIVVAKEALEIDDDKVAAIKKIDEAHKLSSQFISWFQVTIDSVRQDRRKMRKIALDECVASTAKSWEEALQNKNIKIVTKLCEVNYSCFSYEIESIFHNLIANSVASFDRKRQQFKNITIRLSEADEWVIIEYSDNGVGLSQKYKKNPDTILEALESDKKDENGELIGTGMGMWIVNKTVKEYKGKIDLRANLLSNEGFSINIFLKK